MDELDVEPRKAPLTFEFRIRHPSAELGHALRIEQAKAIRGLLIWAREERLRSGAALDEETSSPG